MIYDLIYYFIGNLKKLINNIEQFLITIMVSLKISLFILVLMISSIYKLNNLILI